MFCNSGGTLPWSSYKVITMIVLGPIILIGFTFYEAKVASLPFIPARFLKNRTVIAAGLIGFFDFISFYMQYTYQYAFICRFPASLAEHSAILIPHAYCRRLQVSGLESYRHELLCIYPNTILDGVRYRCRNHRLLLPTI